MLRESDLEADLRGGFRRLRSEFDARSRSFVLATGPSATGDMGELVRGVHGPNKYTSSFLAISDTSHLDPGHIRNLIETESEGIRENTRYLDNERHDAIDAVGTETYERFGSGIDRVRPQVPG